MKSVRNYIIVLFIYVITILGVFYFISLYKKANTFVYDDSFSMFVLDSSDYDKFHDNIANYVYENDSFVVYYSLNGVSDDLKNFMVDYDFSHEFLYVNDFSSFNRLISDFSYDFSGLVGNSYFVYFYNGKVVDVVDCSSFSYDSYVDYFSKVGLL